MEAPRPHRPPAIRLINGVGRLAARLGLERPSLREEDLLRAARKQTGFDDFGSDHFREGLRRLLDSLDRDAALTTLGRMVARGQIVSNLANRLGVVAHRKQHPEIEKERIERPLFVLGLPRTGTTILYGLLAQDPLHRSPSSWEVGHPCPPAREETYDTDPRIAQLDAELDGVRRLAPGFDAIHPMAAHLPQECVAITSMDFHSIQFSTTYRLTSYERWIFEQDMRPAYRFHREVLQHMQSEFARPRWVLKSPAHLSTIDSLLDVYPDAMIVQTHRNPLDVLASVSSLTCVLRAAASDDVDPLEIGREQVEVWPRILNKGMADRANASHESERFFDVHFPDLLADPIGCVERIYGHFDLELTREARERMTRFLADNSREKHGRHSYAPEVFGIDPARDAPHFQAYCERFGIETGSG